MTKPVSRGSGRGLSDRELRASISVCTDKWHTKPVFNNRHVAMVMRDLLQYWHTQTDHWTKTLERDETGSWLKQGQSQP